MKLTATESIKAGSGTPLFVVLAKILGALPCFARPKTVREAWNRRQLVQDQALVITIALHRSGRNGISSLRIAMMKGDLATPFPCAIASSVKVIRVNRSRDDQRHNSRIVGSL